MESGDHFKNGARPKSQMNKRFFLKRFALLSAGAFVFGRQAGAQNVDTLKCGCTINKTPLRIGSSESIQILNVGGMPQVNEYSYMGNSMYYLKLQNPVMIFFDTQVIVPTKVKYSLYTYKKTFDQDGGGNRNFLRNVESCLLDNPLTTQADIDKALDKIYEFPEIMESKSGKRELFWDMYTDPKFTGQKYAVRDCIHVAAHNADTGELIGILNTGSPQAYQVYTRPGINYRIDQRKDANGKVVKETLSAQVMLAYSDSRPVKKISVLLTMANCALGSLSFEEYNQGADAIVPLLNSNPWVISKIVAHTALTNPTIYNQDIKIFDWKDIKGEDGKDFIPDLEQNKEGYSFAIMIETDEMTYTGIKNGYLYRGENGMKLPVPKIGVANETIEKSEIRIISDENGLVVLCTGSVSAKSYAVYDMVGRMLKTGSLSGVPRETITAPELRGGVYFVHLQVNENGAAKTVTKKVVRK